MTASEVRSERSSSGLAAIADSIDARYLLRRLLLTVPVLLGVATLVFALIHLVPGDPAQSMLGEARRAEEVAELRARLGLDRPLLDAVRARSCGGVVRGDLGTSFRYGTPVTQRDPRAAVRDTVQLAAGGDGGGDRRRAFRSASSRRCSAARPSITPR